VANHYDLAQYVVLWLFRMRRKSEKKTFQAAIVSDGHGQVTFVIFYYHKIRWTAGTFFWSAADCSGQSQNNGSGAKAGFDVGDNRTFYDIPGSRTPEMINITQGGFTRDDYFWILDSFEKRFFFGRAARAR